MQSLLKLLHIALSLFILVGIYIFSKRTLLGLNSDVLLSHSFISDLISNTGDLWTLPPNTYWFFDHAIYTLIYHFSKNVLLNHLIWSFICFSAIWFMQYTLLSKVIFKGSFNKSHFKWVVVFIIIDLLIWYTPMVIQIGHHVSVYILLLIWALMLQYTNKPKIYLILFILTVLVAASDTLVYPQVVIPLILLGVISWVLNKTKIELCGLIAVPIFSIPLNQFIKHLTNSLDAKITLFKCNAKEDYFNSFLNVSNDLWRIFIEQPPFLLALSIPSLIYVFYSLLKACQKKQLSHQLLIISLLLLSTLGSISSTILSCSYNDTSNFRYLIPALFLTPILCLYMLFVLKNRADKAFKWYAAVIILFFLLFIIRQIPEVSSTFSTSVYPHQQASCVAQVINHNNLNNGVAHYWHTKSIMAHEPKVKLIQMDQSNWQIYNWIINYDKMKRWQDENINFIIANEFNTTNLIEAFGEPVKKMDCLGLKIWIYEESLNHKFHQLSDE